MLERVVPEVMRAGPGHSHFWSLPAVLLCLKTEFFCKLYKRKKKCNHGVGKGGGDSCCRC